ncbi:MAG: DNA repair protein [Flammeovirgaceae bacterium]|nr:DNA repair protein [Flammeovirgaceae bacterium]|tara:strand:+ start:1408 stop:1878 length:471 start_codon:yes stop_codon:yes gene_type:complete
MNELTDKFEEVRLVYKNKTRAADRPQVNCAQKAYEVLLKSWNPDEISLLEECKVLLLDTNLRLMSIATISKGGLSGTVVDPRIVFSIALKRRASAIILAHNHPSGNLQASGADLLLTREFVKAGKTLKIPLEDHLIITPDGYTALISENYLGYDQR